MPLSTLTPIRIRGKRGAVAEVKWKPHKRRRRAETSRGGSQNTSTSVSISSSRASSMRPDKRARRNVESMRLNLEVLPTEILQAIFVLSKNPYLPLATVGLARQLTSRHLFMSLSDDVLGKVVGFDNQTNPTARASEEDLAAATRLLDSRFMTLDFFKDWIMRTAQLEDNAEVAETPVKALWLYLKPSKGLLPPPKILQGPWTTDRVKFLQCLSAPDIRGLTLTNLYYSDLAQEGLAQAVAARSVQAVGLLIDLGCRGTQELIRQAIVDDGCVREIVQALFRHAVRDEQYDTGSERWTRTSTVDCLDPVLWAWVAKAEKEGNPDGAWLKNLLRSEADNVA